MIPRGLSREMKQDLVNIERGVGFLEDKALGIYHVLSMPVYMS
jgi:hypothetical protein